LLLYHAGEEYKEKKFYILHFILYGEKENRSPPGKALMKSAFPESAVCLQQAGNHKTKHSAKEGNP
jgi:hypothetical protein